MKIVETRLLRGPNLYSHRPCLLAVLDLEALDDVPSTALPGFVDALCAALPSLREHRCSRGYEGGFVERLREGTYMAHIVEHVLLELQCLAGSEVGFGRARMVPDMPRHYTVVCAYHVEQLARAALDVALDMVATLAKGEPYDIAPALAALHELVERHAPGPSTQAILHAARRRGIPALHMAEGTSLFQLGWGRRQQRLQATMTGRSSYIATEIASDKQLTKDLLREIGLPVPEGGVAESLEEALALLESRGGAVAVKPLDANQGKGVTLNVRTPAELRQAYENAQNYSRDVIVERCVRGHDYRVLVVNGKVVAAAQRRPACVVGDGEHSIAELVDIENTNPARGNGHCCALTRLCLDEKALACLAVQHFAAETVLPPGTTALLRDNANLSTGGTAEDVTDRLHPWVAADCVRAAQRIGLDVAGIDLVCHDIGVPLQEQGGAIIEVNAAPGIRMHQSPSSGQARDVGAAIVDGLFPAGNDGRIPLIAVTGTNGKTTTTLLIANAMREQGLVTGYATTEGIYINDRQIAQGDCSGFWSARTVLSSPDVEMAVLETARGGILKRGLAFDRCDVGVVLNVSVDHIGQDRIQSLEDLARVKRVVAEAAAKAVVLNADDALCRDMVDYLREGVEVVYFSLEPESEPVRKHLAKGGRALVLEEGAIVLAVGQFRKRLLDVCEMPFALGGRARFNVANALAAVAAAVAADCPTEPMVRALTRFRSDADDNPLRLNLFDVEGVTVLVDYAHNPSAYRAIADTCRQCTQGRVVAVVTAPGDRRDAELEETGAVCGACFDEVIVFEMDDLRGREAGSAAAFLTAGARRQLAHGLVQCVPDVRRALERGLTRCRPGDLLVFGCASSVDELRDALALLPDQPQPQVVQFKATKRWTWPERPEERRTVQ